MAVFGFKLSGDEQELEFLSQVFRSRCCSVRQEDDKYYLYSVRFNSVLDIALIQYLGFKLSEYLHGVTRDLLFDSRHGISVGRLHEVRADGTNKVYPSSYAVFTLHDGNPIGLHPGYPIDSLEYNEGVQLLNLVDSNQKLKTAITMLDRREPTWDDL